MGKQSIVDAARHRQRQGGKTPPTPASAQHLDFVSDRQYEQPLLGIIKTGALTGQMCSVLERGNSTGMSATWLVNTQGRVPTLYSLGDVELTGFTCGVTPPANTQLLGIFESVTIDDAA